MSGVNMRTHVEAVEALVTPLGRDVHWIEVRGTPRYPLIVLRFSTGRLDAPALDGARSDLRDLLYVTCTGLTPESVLEVSRLTRERLDGAAPAVAGRHVHPLRWWDGQDVDVDNRVKDPTTSQSPFYGVDIYRIQSEPA